MNMIFQGLLGFITLLITLPTFAEIPRNELVTYWKKHDKINVANDVLFPRKERLKLTIQAGISPEVFDLVDESSDIASATTVAPVQDFFTKFKDNDQFVTGTGILGIPLLKFNFDNFLLKIDLEGRYHARGISLAISDASRTSSVEACAFYQFFYPGQACRTELTSDIVNSNFFGIAYTVETWKAGINTQWIGTQSGNFSLNVKPYMMERKDAFEIVTHNVVINDDKFLRLSKNKNTTRTINVDVGLTYNDKTTFAYAGIEELRIKKVEDNASTETEDSRGPIGELLLGNSPLYKAHVQRCFRKIFFDPCVFVGTHKRQQYKWKDGHYAGLKLDFITTKLLDFSVMGMADNYFHTASANIKIWLMDIVYSFKKPVHMSELNVKELHPVHAAKIRFFF